MWSFHAREYVKKPGRKRKNGIEGLIITDEIKSKFKIALEKHYLNVEGNTLVFAYKEMLRKFFYQEKYYKEGIKHILLKPEEELPTFEQFRYFFFSEYKTDDIKKARVGNKAFERDYRAVLGSSTFKSFGPGSIYQIDSTPANIFIVNRANRNWTIGRPLIYFVTDVFSRMITGLYIGLENDSWVAAMMGIENAISDKTEYCRKYGININNDLWPAKNLPEKIVGDRGPLEGYSVNNLIDGLDIDIDLNPAYRPDWKGIVEQLMNKSQSTIRPFLPGYIDKNYGERGAKDPRTKATLTLEEYIKIMINFVNFYNHNYYIKDYVRDIEMVEEEVKPIPIELWKWGIKNRSGKLRKKSKKAVRFHLLPQDEATVTRKGIKYKKMLYTCKKGIEEGWFSKQRSWKIRFSYDPRNMNQIYLHTNNKDVFEICYLLDHQERYIDLSKEEIDQLLIEESELFGDVKHELLQNELNFFDNIEHIVNQAKIERKEQYDNTISDSERKKNYRERKSEEKNHRRKDEAFNLDSNKVFLEDTPLNHLQESDSGEMVDNLKDLFRENWGKK